MKRVLLTGATGFLGSYVARLLIEKGYEVIAIHRQSSRFELVREVKSKIEWIECDLEELPILEEIIKRVDVVVHCAALISFQPQDNNLMYKINVEATRDLVDLSLANSVERFVYISSIAALGRHKNDEILDEKVEWQDGPLNTNYGISKQLGEREVWRGSAEGLNVIILNPSLIIGTGFWLEGSPALIANAQKGYPFYPKGSTGFVDVRDVAKLCVDAIKSNISAKRIIVSAENITYLKFFSILAKEFEKRRPSIALSQGWIAIAWRLDLLLAKILRRKRMFSKESLDAASRRGCYDNSLSKEIFDFQYRSIASSLNEMAIVYTNSRLLSNNYGLLPL